MRIVQTVGNKSLWQREKTLFLTSRQAPLACYGWVFQWVEEFDKWGCAVCFNTSELEEEVLKALLVCHVPTALVVTVRFHDIYNVQIELALREKRLLIVVLQPEENDGKGYLARLRNQYVISQVQHIACGHISPNGSIIGLLAGLNNVTWLLQKEDLRMAAEQPEKPYRWTVAEDKRLLRMFYEDMGIHAIHKALSRPYSTIYNRIKALTIDDEALKGREFEDYVVELFGLPKNDSLVLKEWRGDKSLPGIYPESNSAPDLVFTYEGQSFAIECKWRSHMPKDIGKELLPPDRKVYFQRYAEERKAPVCLILGVGGLPNDPEMLLMAPVADGLTIERLRKSAVQPEKILGSIVSMLQKKLPFEEVYLNHYAPWSEADDVRLTALFHSGKTIADLMTTFGRTRNSISYRLRKLGLVRQ